MVTDNDEPWVGVEGAIKMARDDAPDMSIGRARATVLAAVRSGEVRTRSGGRGHEIHADRWHLALALEGWRVRCNVLEADGRLRPMWILNTQISADDLTDWLAQQHRRRNGGKGPRPGEVARFLPKDRALFPEIEKLMRKKNLSLTQATNELAHEGRVDGVGTAESRAKRLARVYRHERGRTHRY